MLSEGLPGLCRRSVLRHYKGKGDALYILPRWGAAMLRPYLEIGRTLNFVHALVSYLRRASFMTCCRGTFFSTASLRQSSYSGAMCRMRPLTRDSLMRTWPKLVVTFTNSRGSTRRCA